MKPVLVRDLALERWPSMDRYAEALSSRIPGAIVPPGWAMDGPRYLRRYWSYPRALRGYRGDVVHILDHSYSHCLKSFPGLPSVVTVHDLHPLRVLAEEKRSARTLVRDRLLRWVLDWMERADRFIVSTAWTARELERFLSIDASRIRIVPYGIDEHFRAAPAAAGISARREEWARRTGSNPALVRVLLHVGSCAPRKNVEAALTALGLLRARGRDAILVQIGGQFTHTHFAAINDAGVAGHIVQEPSVSEAGLLSAYQAADVVVMPSTFEGFGLPAVEAMAAGAPVVTSGAGGLREAVGDAALVTKATDGATLADAVEAVLEDPVCRSDLIARGRVRAGELTWERTAKETMRVYSELANGS